MKILHHFFAFILPISILLIACNKGENPPIKQGVMWDCHYEMTWDSVSTYEALMGEWKWEYIGCNWNPEDANSEEFEGMTIEFKKDGTLDVQEQSQIIQTSDWNVKRIEADLFEVDCTPVVYQLRGRILFCNDIVEFNHGYIDGCNNYFRRIN